MKRLVLALPVLALVLSACAVGDPKPTTYISDIGATLNGDVSSSFVGDTEFWWKYGETTAYDLATPHRSVAIADDQPHPVSQPISDLTPDTTYHFQMCVQDGEEDPPRVVCSTDRTFTTDSAGGRSGIAFTSERLRDREVWVMDEDGGNQANLSNNSSGEDEYPVWSPDGRKLAFVSRRDHNNEVYVMDADGSNQTNLTNSAGDFETDPFSPDDITPAWSPDGSKIAFSSGRDGNREIFMMDADGSNPTNLTNSPHFDSQPAWSPDGRRIAFSSGRVGLDYDIYVMDADGSDPTNLTNHSNDDFTPAWSPDGTKIAFGSDRDGDAEVYVMGADGSNPTNLTNLTNNPAYDADPAWSPDGSMIAFQTNRDGFPRSEIYVMGADGSNPANVSNNSTGFFTYTPDWSPRP